MFPLGYGRIRLAAVAAAAVLVLVIGNDPAAAQLAPTGADQTAGQAHVHGAAGHTHGSHGLPAAPLTSVPPDDPDRGLIYSGLVAARTGPCAGLYQVAGVSHPICTHGPDAPPPGLSVTRSVAPLPPRTTASPQALAVCEGDGVSGRRVEVLYIHGSVNRYQQFLETFRQLAESVDTIFFESARETGGERRVRYVTETVNGQCRPVVRDVQIPDAALNADDWAPLLNAVRAAGFTRTDRKYLQFVDARVFCGIGGFAGDTRKTASNRSNSGPEYARVDNGCWNPGVAAHELGHTLGAVNNNAPNGSGLAHCVDEWDVMCYRDSANTVIRTSCPDRAHDQRLDCNHDDYYHTNPPAGSYLATFFNVADNLFLIPGNGGPPPPGGNLALSATPGASFTSAWETVLAINDGIEPSSSNDTVNPRWGTWPEVGQQWAELTWNSPVTISSADVYFFDDDGGIAQPASWTLQSWNGSSYVNVSNSSGYPTAINQYNRVTFTAVSTTRLRVLLQSGEASVGLLEVKAFGP
jgi:hypothetical protein